MEPGFGHHSRPAMRIDHGEKESMNNFEKLTLSPEILDAIRVLGFERPFPIQEAVIPLLRQGSDIIGQAHTGTGKTAAFGLPLLEIVDEKNLNIQALVLVPTRELAVQVASDIKSYGRFTRKHALAIYGGQSINAQIRDLKDCPQIIVGTPGRVIDHLERGSLHLEKVHFVVLDEADRMLDMGFIDDVEHILTKTGRKRQIAFFSATMPKEMLKLARRHMENPREVLIEPEDLNVKQIRQYYCRVNYERKFDALLRILQDKEVRRAIVFCRTKRNTFWLNKSLGRRNQNAIALNGDLTQYQRDRAMNAFRSGQSRILVATDLAGRGLDIDGVTHIINYDVPQDPYAYFHRIGRTGRAGKAGKAVTIVSTEQFVDFRTIQSMADDRIERLDSNSDPDEFTARREGSNRSGDEIRRTFDRRPNQYARHTPHSNFRRSRRRSRTFVKNRRFL
jgi:ATP-dependent RNA helicase DeaD